MIDTTSYPNAQPIDFVPPDRLHLSSPTRPDVFKHLRLREMRLRQAVPAIESIVSYRRKWGVVIPDTIWPLYAAAKVELALIRGELGVTDETHIEILADTMDASDAEARALWAEKKAIAEANDARNRARAHHDVTHRGAGKIWCDPMVTLMDVSVALNLSAYMKREIFPKGVKTGLPTVNPAAGPSFRGDWARVPYTLVQLKDWCRRLGFSPDTISENARKLSEAEFNARIAKREADLLPPSRLEGKKLPGESDWHASKRIAKDGPRTRKRAPCITSERRDLAAEMGAHPDTVKKRTKGWTMEQIQALRGDPARAFSALGLSLRGRSTPDKDVRSTPNKTAKIGLFCPTDVSGNESQGVELEALSEESPTARKVTRHKRGPHDPYQYAYGINEADVLYQWYKAKRGRDLSEEAARKWHERGTFERNFLAACEWVVAQNFPDDEYGPNPIRNCAEFWLDAYLTQGRKRRASKRGSKLMPAWMIAYSKACEEGAETMFEIFPAPAVAEAA